MQIPGIGYCAMRSCVSSALLLHSLYSIYLFPQALDLYLCFSFPFLLRAHNGWRCKPLCSSSSSSSS
uniref:Putative secreted protein n=1 Tax=Anopheles darlingi TaxID=43151 RepID=A0A2M4D5I6_ANODA